MDTTSKYNNCISCTDNELRIQQTITTYTRHNKEKRRESVIMCWCLKERNYSVKLTHFMRSF